MQGARWPGGSQRWTASTVKETKKGSGSAPASTPSGSNTVINSLFERNEERTGHRYSFPTRASATQFLDLIDHGIPPEMAADLVD